MYTKTRVNNWTLTLSLLTTCSLSISSTLFSSLVMVVFKYEISSVFSFTVACLTASASLYGIFPNKLVGVNTNPMPRHIPIASTPNTFARESSLDAKY